MICERTLDNGIDVYCCPLCGRKLLIQWAPIIRQAVLEPGDKSVVHSASPTGEPNFTAAQNEYTEADPVPDRLIIDSADRPRLQRWGELLAAVDFESWWMRPLT